MYGGLKKSASRLALVAAAGVLSTGAYAADLGGDCCADLEERVAELEATTARKGNRKVSLTISGQVNRTIMYWNDGARSNTYFGLDNTNTSTRFGLSGNAKISPAITAGYSILIDVADRARTVSVRQTGVAEDGGTRDNANSNADHLLRLRDANWWLEHNQIGRITIGRLTTSSPTGTLDLGGVGVVATAGEGCIGTSLKVRQSNGVLANTGKSLGDYGMNCAHPAFRGEGIKYTSPTLAGFTFSASVAEAAKLEINTIDGIQQQIGRNYGADLRYAGEFSGVRVAASIGYERSVANEDDSGSSLTVNDDYRSWGGALSLMHVPTGLFIQGEVISATKAVQDSAGGHGPDKSANRWHVQGGIAQNWFGIGITSLYGEYGKHNDFNTLNSWTSAGASSFAGQTSDEMRIWGIGVVQNIDAAAMQLYLGYRNYAFGDNSTATIAAGGLNSIDVVAAGARIRF